MGRVQQKVQFSHFSVVKCKIWMEIMNIWNYDICVWHPPTLICPNFLCKRNYANVLKICSFFWRLSLWTFLILIVPVHILLIMFCNSFSYFRYADIQFVCQYKNQVYHFLLEKEVTGKGWAHSRKTWKLTLFLN